MTDPPIHVRTIRVEARRLRERELEVKGHLVDERPQAGAQWFDTTYDTTVHDMTLTLRVRYPDLVITEAGGSMRAHPDTICPDALPPLGRLVGLSVAQGFTRAVNE